MTEDEVRRCTILRGLVGSTVHGLAIEGQDDRDEMGICVEPIERVVGFSQFEQFIHRDQPEGVRSQPGNLDLTVYSLRKWSRLALAGNPTILLLLFVPPDSCMVRTTMGTVLQDMAWNFASRKAGNAFLGYLTAQKQRLTGERGQMRIHRPELIEKYGFDTKYAMHMVRLGLQGIEFLETGRISLPMREPDRSYVRDVREGRVKLNDVLTYSGELEHRLKDDLISNSGLPDTPNEKEVEKFVVTCYSKVWFPR